MNLGTLGVIDNGDGTLTSVVNNHLPGENGDITYQRSYFNDEGQVVKVVTTFQFGELVDRVDALPESKESASTTGIDEIVDYPFPTSPYGTLKAIEQKKALRDETVPPGSPKPPL